MTRCDSTAVPLSSPSHKVAASFGALQRMARVRSRDSAPSFRSPLVLTRQRWRRSTRHGTVASRISEEWRRERQDTGACYRACADLPLRGQTEGQTRHAGGCARSPTKPLIGPAPLQSPPGLYLRIPSLELPVAKSIYAPNRDTPVHLLTRCTHMHAQKPTSLC